MHTVEHGIFEDKRKGRDEMFESNRRAFLAWFGSAAATVGLGFGRYAGAQTPPVRTDTSAAVAPRRGRPVFPPWSIIDDFPLFDDYKDLRIRNRATVEKYLSMTGKERVDRWQFYTERCQQGLCTKLLSSAATLEGGVARVRTQKEVEAEMVDLWPDWSFYNNILFETEDPNYILAEGDGSGLSYLRDRKRANIHSSHYFHIFRLERGRIQSYTEFRNRFQEIREWGLVPVVPFFSKYESMYEPVAKEDETYVCSYKDDKELRRRNLDTVKKYFSYSGAGCAARWQLFTEDGSTGPGYTADGRILRAVGINKIKSAEAIRAECFPDWNYTAPVIHQTTDPNYFAADGIGKGVCVGYADKPFEYSDHFYYSFRMNNGRIKDLRDYSDPGKIGTLIGWDFKIPADAAALAGFEPGTASSRLSPK